MPKEGRVMQVIARTKDHLMEITVGGQSPTHLDDPPGKGKLAKIFKI